MISFSAIIKLTLRNALRSHIFQLLLGLMAVCAVALPWTVDGSGEGLRSTIQIALKYSLGTVGFILVLSTVWLSSLVMTQDVESYQLHMVVAKPVSRVKIFLAKYFSVVLLHAILLLLAGIAVYGIVMFRIAGEPDMTDAEREQINSEVLVGRRVYLPKAPDMDRLTAEALAKKLEEIRQSGRAVTANAAELEDDIRKSFSDEMMRMRSEVLFQKYGEWEFENLPVNYNGPIYLRYRLYVGKVDSEAQRYTSGQWEVYLTRLREGAGVGPDGQAAAIADEDYMRDWVKLPPEQNYAGEFHEKIFPAEAKIVDPQSASVKLRYLNYDDAGDRVYFQSDDGPKLLIKVTGFLGNFIRSLLVILLLIMVYAGISCAAAAAFSMPTAIFTVLSYMFLGSVAPLIMTTTQLRDNTAYAGYSIGKVVLLVVAPLQNFDVSEKIAGGELIEISFLGSLFLWHFVLQALPFIVLGGFLYWRRELGLVIRK